MKNLALIFTSIFLGAMGQILLKKGMLVYGAVDASRIWSQIFRVLMVPHILIGLVCFSGSFVLWLSVISRNEISYAYPMVSVSYVVILLVSALWFHEAVSLMRIAGVLLICLGVVAITRT